jgi:tetratricopeptide (TPR) repeat protein
MDPTSERAKAPSEAAYRSLRPIGAGAFGTVTEAICLRTGRRVALKELARPFARSLVQFKQEFRALADVHHAHLVELYELFERDGRWFIAMELVEGDDFLRWVRPYGSERSGREAFDEPRLRGALAGMARGLAWLHESGFLHRDLKPSNVRVTAEGRAVLLDFGLVTTADPDRQSSQTGVLGTVEYMAPEQAMSHPLSPAADWYALGSCLYEALTGRLPFEGSVQLRIALDKQQRRPPPPSAHVAPLPRDLEALCVALLATDPAARPSAAEILRVLEAGEGVPSTTPSRGASLPAPASQFAGREAELEHLEHALAETRKGALRVLLVEGDSGVGKSALVGEFLERQLARQPNTLVLRGRCYENEQLPYKAFDGSMDELSRWLRRLPQPECSALLPRRALLLGQLFPVLRDVPAVAQAPARELSADPTARRLEAFSALGLLLGKLAETRPLVLLIDDLQWADAESFRLLRALVEHPDPPPLLVLGTVRPRSELEPDVLASIEAVRSWHVTSVVPLLGLPRATAQALAATLLGPEAPHAWSLAIAQESRGHPLFLSELVSFTHSYEFEAGGAINLEAALSARIESVAPEARALLELSALLGRPYGMLVLARALGVDSIDELARELLAHKLLRVRRGHELSCYHDRIRHVVLKLIDKRSLPALHRRLAHTLATFAAADASEQARHWDLAGEVEEAIAAYRSAADQALEMLAFVRAESCYARALVLLGAPSDARYRELLVLRGLALSRAGRSAEAAVVFAQAAALSSGEERVRLSVRAAQQHIQGASIEQGLNAARTLLADLGVDLPVSLRGALLRIGWDRLCVALQRDKLERLTEAPRSLADPLVFDALEQLSQPIMLADTLTGAALNAHYVRHALRCGEPGQVARAATLDAFMRTVQRGPDVAAPLFKLARKFAEQSQDSAFEAFLAFHEGAADTVAWKLERARERLESAQALVQMRLAGEPWLLTNIRMSLGGVLRHVGDHRTLARTSTTWLAEARERQDRFAVALLAGIGCGWLRHLMWDEPDAARAELDQAFSYLPQEPFGYAHFGELYGVQQTLLYGGGSSAQRWLSARASRYEKVLAFKTRFVGEVYQVTHALAQLAACVDAPQGARAAYLARAKLSVKRLSGIDSPYAQGTAALARSQIHVLLGQPELALPEAQRARQAFAALGLFTSHAASYLEGLIEAGQSGRERCEMALSAYAEQGWKDPRRAMLATVPIAPLIL